MKILTNTEKKKITKQLEEQFGITQVPWLLLQFGKEKIRAFSGSLSREELALLDRELRVEAAGIYFLNVNENELRLSLDTLHLLKEQITKNIILVNDSQASEWFKGHDVSIDKEIQKGFVVLKYKDSFIGCGKSLGNIIKNYMPKERRIR